MNRKSRLRTALLAIAALAMLALLAFLFVRSSAIDFRRAADSAALLRELRALDASLDSDAQRLVNDLSLKPATIADRKPQVDRILRELDPGSLAPTVAEQVPALRSGMQEKVGALAGLKAAHAKSLAALHAAEESLATLAAEANAARLKDPRTTQRALELAVRTETVRLTLRTGGIDGAGDMARSLDARLASQRAAAAAADPALAEAGERSEQAARAFLDARQAESEAWKRYSFLTVGPKVELTARTLGSATQAALFEQERWRIYLFFYAAALLIGVGYLATRVIAAQAALREANEGLEKRVAERTQELSTTLERLKESEAQLVQTEKMSSLGQMVAGVAHEINTPLAYVKNSVATVRDRMPELQDAVAQSERLLALLQSDAPDQADLQETFGALAGRLEQLRGHHVMQDLGALTQDGLHGIEQISELVANLKNFSRLDRARVASFNVNEGVRATLLIAKPQLHKIDVERDLSEDLPSITCSPSQVNQVLLNLVTNATQAIDKPRGLIRVRTRPVAGAVTIEITDNGKGIPPENLPRIFDPFFTTKEVGKGTGLGLSIAYKIATQHGGRIDVQSEVGTGTTFTVTLPITPPPELAHDGGEAAA